MGLPALVAIIPLDFAQACTLNQTTNSNTQVGCTEGSSGVAATVKVTGASATSPVTITIPAGSGSTDGVHTETTNGAATTTVTNATINNKSGPSPSLGINNVVGNTGVTGDSMVTVSGTNIITTTNGGGLLSNDRGTGNASMIITGTLTVNNNSTNSATEDGIESTSRSGNATLDMSGVDSAVIHEMAGNGILIDSLGNAAGVGGKVSATINGNVKVILDNTVSGAKFSNAGIRAATLRAGTVDLTTAATVNTIGSHADGISAVSELGTIAVTNSGAVTTSGILSNGIEATANNLNAKVTGTSTALDTGTVTVTNSGAITTTGGGTAATASNGIFAWTESTGSGASGSVIVETFEGPRPWRSPSPARIRIDSS
jgi:autotransporter family porin